MNRLFYLIKAVTFLFSHFRSIILSIKLKSLFECFLAIINTFIIWWKSTRKNIIWSVSIFPKTFEPFFHMGFYGLWAICSIQATIHSSFSYPLLLGYPIGLLMPRLESRPLRIRNGRRLQRSIELYGLISLYGWEGRLCSSEARPLLRILVCSTISVGF